MNTCKSCTSYIKDSDGHPKCDIYDYRIRDPYNHSDCDSYDPIPKRSRKKKGRKHDSSDC